MLALRRLMISGTRLFFQCWHLGANVGLSCKRDSCPQHGTAIYFIEVSELDAFQAYAEIYPDDCLLLVDTVNTLRGIPNAIKDF